MNRKFFTLTAGLLLASAFSANAEKVVSVAKVVSGKQYVIAETGWGTSEATEKKAVLSKNADAADAVGVIGEASKYADAPKWTVEKQGEVQVIKIADGKYLTANEGNTDVSLEALGETPFTTQAIVPGADKIQVGGTNHIKFGDIRVDLTYPVSLENNATSSFYALQHEATDEGMTGLLSEVTASFLIRLGDKYVAAKSLGAGETEVELISLDSSKPGYYEAVKRATWKNAEGKFQLTYGGPARTKLGVDSNGKLALATAGKDFTFDFDEYAAVKGASLYQGTKVINGEGKAVDVEVASLSNYPEALLFKAAPVVTAAADGAITADEFENGGWYNVSFANGVFLKDNGDGTGYSSVALDDANADNFLWQVTIKKVAGQQVVTLLNKKSEKYLTLSESSSFITADEGYTLGMQLKVGAGYVKYIGNAVSTGGTASEAATMIGLHKPANKKYDSGDLNAMEDGGFTMTVSTAKKDGTTDIEGVKAFDGKLKAVNTADNKRFQLQTEATNETYVALNVKDTWGTSVELNGTNDNARGYKFTTVKKADLKDNHYTWFSAEYPGTNDKDTNKELILKVYSSKDAAEEVGQLYVTKVADKYYLTASKNVSAASKEAWPYVTLGGATLVDLTETFVAAPTYYSIVKVSDEGKALKALGVAFADAEGQWLDLDAVQLDQPEGQWYATSTTDKTKLVLANRENPEVTKTFTSLYKTDKTTDLRAASTIYKSGTDYLVLTPTALADAKTSDGYEIWDQNNLRDEEYTIAISTVLGNGYLAENHAGKHQIGIETDAKNAVAWKLTALTAKASDDAITDSVYVKNTIRYWNANKKGSADWDEKVDYLKLVPYTITNAANGEPLYFDESSDVDAFVCSTDANKVDRFVIKKSADGKYNLIRVVKTEISEGKFAWTLEDKVYVGTSANYGNVQLTNIYQKRENDAFVIEKAAAPEYLKLNLGDTIRIFREGAESSLLFEKGEFLGLENIYEYTKMAPAMYVDTAFVNRTGKDNYINNCYQYLLAVEPDRHQTSEECTIPGHPSHSTDITYGRYLVSLEDSAKVEATRNLHTNKYVNSEGLAKFGFVKASHANDTLVIANSIYTGTLKQDKDSINMGTKDFNVAKFAFKVADQDTKAFRIQTGDKKYLKWMNGFIVATEGETNGDIFNLKATDENPTANEAIAAEGVQVVAGKGAVTVQGAAGKVITVANILGQTIANQVAASDNVTIAVPAGIVVVAVEGEATKVVVK